MEGAPLCEEARVGALPLESPHGRLGDEGWGKGLGLWSGGWVVLSIQY
jgi:hypothetical protein